MPESLEELIYQTTHGRVGGFDGSWTADELYDALLRAAKLDLPVLRAITKEVGIEFEGEDEASQEECLLVLDEADDKEKLKRLLSEHGV